MSDIDFSEIFNRIPLLANSTPDDYEITPLTGLTNLNFRLHNARYDYVLRIPRAETNETINRKVEASNIDRAIQLGLAPRLLWGDDNGLSLTRCITHSRALTQSDLRNRKQCSKLLDQVARLHKAEPGFEGRTDLRALLMHYSGVIPNAEDNRLTGCFEKALDLYQMVKPEDQTYVPSHNDLVLENLLVDQQQRLWMIDWEYSSMSSPYWDLATICNVGRLTQQEASWLLSQYCKQAFQLDIDLLYRYQYMLQVLTVGWLLTYSPASIEVELDWLNKLEV